MNLYAQNILDHYKNPRNQGKILAPSITRREANYSCGDIIEVDLKIEKNKILDIKFRAEGCAISQAAISILSENFIGKKVQDIIVMKEKDVVGLLGIDVSERRKGCALLGFLAVRKALIQYMGK